MDIRCNEECSPCRHTIQVTYHFDWQTLNVIYWYTSLKIPSLLKGMSAAKCYLCKKTCWWEFLKRNMASWIQNCQKKSHSVIFCKQTWTRYVLRNQWETDAVKRFREADRPSNTWGRLMGLKRAWNTYPRVTKCSLGDKVPKTAVFRNETVTGIANRPIELIVSNTMWTWWTV